MAKNTHGGFRENSGPKKRIKNRIKKQFYITAEKEDEIRLFIKNTNVYESK